MLKRIVFLCFSLMLSSLASAELVQITAVPTTWRLSNYFGDGAILVRNTPSVCTTGKMTLPVSATESQRNRFWSMILMANATNRQVVVEYENTTTTCEIRSFTLKEK